MKSNIDILCRYIRYMKSGTTSELRGLMIAHGRNMKNADRDIRDLVAVGMIHVSKEGWVCNLDSPLWESINRRLNSADNKDY